MVTKILLVDDHRIMRDGLRVLLEHQDGLQVVGEAANGREAIDAARALQPDVVVMDVGMPDLNGIEATRQILAMSPSTKVVALSMHSDRRYVVQMLKAGALAYVLKNCASDELVRAIRDVQHDRRFVSQSISSVLAEYVAAGGTATSRSVYTELTSREREVLQLLAQGSRSKQIAKELNMALKTVETHRRDIMQRLNLHTIAELTLYAAREGLISLDG